MLCLAMIVKNEARNIVDTLDSVLPHVGAVCIVDTGSTDETRDLVLDRLRAWQPANVTGIYSRVECRPWVDFSHNRNECLDLARELCGADDWILMMSGDSLLVRDPRLDPLGALVAQEAEMSSHSAFAIQTQLGTLEYPTVRLFRASSDWKYHGKVHEVAKSASGGTYGHIAPESVRVRFLGTDRHDKPAQWRQHLELLREQMTEEGVSNPRTVFYLAQTHACLGAYGDAAALYRLRLAMVGGWEPERWEARLRLATLRGTWSHKERDALLVQCSRDAPSRAEPWYYLAENARGREEWEPAYVCAALAAQCAGYSRAGLLFVRQDIYDYRARLLLAKCAYDTGRYDEARENFEAVLRTEKANRGEVVFIRQRIQLLSVANAGAGTPVA